VSVAAVSDVEADVVSGASAPVVVVAPPLSQATNAINKAMISISFSRMAYRCLLHCLEGDSFPAWTGRSCRPSSRVQPLSSHGVVEEAETPEHDHSQQGRPEDRAYEHL